VKPRILAWLAALALALLAYGLLAAPPGPRSLRSFEPDRMADLEVGMWKAYYAKERLRLFLLLASMLREQYRYPWSTALREGHHLGRAASTFGDLKGGYDKVIPDLEKGYATARAWTGAGFDPGALARAELSWWVARRIPGEDRPEHVAELMAGAYSILYEAPRAAVARAALLRAQAAALRDRKEARPDWPAIGALLRESYRDLHRGLNGAR